jgi:hypothetical protein
VRASNLSILYKNWGWLHRGECPCHCRFAPLYRPVGWGSIPNGEWTKIWAHSFLHMAKTRCEIILCVLRFHELMISIIHWDIKHKQQNKFAVRCPVWWDIIIYFFCRCHKRRLKAYLYCKLAEIVLLSIPICSYIYIFSSMSFL